MCIRTQKDKRKTCWAKWHGSKNLDVIRAVPSSPSPSKKRCIIPENNDDESEEDVNEEEVNVAEPIFTPSSIRHVSRIKRNKLLKDSSVQLTNMDTMVTTVRTSQQPDELSDNVPCSSGCGRDPKLSGTEAAHVCNTCRRPMNGFCVYAPGGSLGGEEYEGFGKGGFCKPCSLNETK